MRSLSSLANVLSGSGRLRLDGDLADVAFEDLAENDLFNVTVDENPDVEVFAL